MRRSLAAVALAVLAFAPGASAADPRGTAGLELQEVAGKYASAIYASGAPGDRKALFVAQLEGKIVVERPGKATRTFIDLTDQISREGERGLLSFAFAPSYEKSRRFYVYLTAPDGAVEVHEYKRSRESRYRADPGSRRVLVSIPHPGAFHNGGTVAFGPDGGLYAATGESGTPSNAQDPDSALGKLLELDPRRPGRYEIVASGFRNPFRFSFDERTRTIAIGDVGQDGHEEVDYLKLADARGANFGWPAFEGDNPSSQPIPGTLPPMLDYPHDGSTCAVTGGITVRDRRLPALDGRYIYADLCAGEVRSFLPRVASNEAEDDRGTGLSVDQPVAFGLDGRGRPLVVSFFGTVYRITDS